MTISLPPPLLAVVVVVVLLACSIDAHILPGESYYYMNKAGERVGPVVLDDLQGAFYSGMVTGGSDVFIVGESTWKHLSTFSDLMDKFSRDRATDPRSNMLYDVDRFISEANLIPYEADQMQHEHLVCARSAAFAAVLKKDKVRTLVLNMVPELKTLHDEVREAAAEVAELQLDLDLSRKAENETVASLAETKSDVLRMIRAEVERLNEAKPTPASLVAWQRIRRVVGEGVDFWEKTVGLQVSKPFKQVKGGWIFGGILVFFGLLSLCSGGGSKHAPKRKRE